MKSEAVEANFEFTLAPPEAELQRCPIIWSKRAPTGGTSTIAAAKTRRDICLFENVPAHVLEELDILDPINEQDSYAMFKQNIRSGLTEADILRYGFSERVPWRRVWSKDQDLKVRSVWTNMMATQRSIDIGWAFANYEHPTLRGINDAVCARVIAPSFKRRYVDAKWWDIAARIGNYRRAQDSISRGNDMLDFLTERLEGLLDVDESEFKRSGLAERYSHCLVHFFADRPGYKEQILADQYVEPELALLANA